MNCLIFIHMHDIDKNVYRANLLITIEKVICVDCIDFMLTHITCGDAGESK